MLRLIFSQKLFYKLSEPRNIDFIQINNPLDI
jgi:hypothetical protein